MLLSSLVAIPALFGLLFLAMAYRAYDWDRYFATAVHTLIAVVFLVIAGAIWVIAANLDTYEPLSGQQQVAEITMRKHEDGHFSAMFNYPNKAFQVFDLNGDEAQVVARVIRWPWIARAIGFEAVFRLERVTSRYREPAPANAAQPSEHVVAAREQLDLWQMAKDKPALLPGIDALTGTAEHVPLVDGALFGLWVSPTGAVIRPLNSEAIKASKR
jgi:hypothetical protein